VCSGGVWLSETFFRKHFKLKTFSEKVFVWILVGSGGVWCVLVVLVRSGQFWCVWFGSAGFWLLFWPENIFFNGFCTHLNAKTFSETVFV
jgi:hypothetical protein